MATARKIEIEAGDFSTGSGAYAELDVPGDYEGVLSKVEDYDYRDKGKSYGWLFNYDVETPAGNSVPFKVYVSFGKAARWKLIEVAEAHGYPVEEGINNIDPDGFAGDVVGLHIDFGTEKNENGEDVPSAYREVQAVFSLAEEPQEPVNTTEPDDYDPSDEPDVI